MSPVIWSLAWTSDSDHGEYPEAAWLNIHFQGKVSKMKRKAAVAGSFYPGSEIPLRAMIRECLFETRKDRVIAALCPHAGYVYSGPVAGAVYSRIEVPGTVVLLGPPHRYPVMNAAVFAEGTWQTPLGEISIDAEFAAALLENSTLIEKDEAPHAPEHSLEVQVPFLQYANPEASIVPVLIGTSRYEALRTIGLDIARGIRESGKEVLIIASSDMSHTESSNPAKQREISELDKQALSEFVALDDKAFHDIITRKHITMCGFAPATAAIIAAKELGATSGELVDYRTSYDVSGNYSYVVGYAGAILK